MSASVSRSGRPPRRAARTAWLLLACGALTAPALALRFPGSAHADRPALQPLRDLDLAAALEGRAGDRWREAASKLPEKCRQSATLKGETDCADDIRCAWLGARAAVAEAWMRGQGEDDAAGFIQRVAARLAGAQCPKEPRWPEDARSAVIDAARVHLALLADLPPADGPSVIGRDDERRVEALVAAARRGGVGSVGAEALRPEWVDLRRTWERRTWLARHPALSRLRSVLAAAWSPFGGPSAECGADLLRNELLTDEWRGFLVRDVTPRALACLQDRLPQMLQSKGLALSDPAAAREIAAALAAEARLDSGGRRFAQDTTVATRIDALASALRAPAHPDQSVRGQAPRGGAARESEPNTRRAVASAKPPPRRASSRASAETRSAADGASAARPAGDNGDRNLLGLAERIGRLTGDLEQPRSAVLRASTLAERAQVERFLLVELHRAVCGPLVEADPEDLEAARRTLFAQGPGPRERACEVAEGRQAVESLLDAAPDLLRLGAAANIRAAARRLALDQPEEAQRRLELVAPRLRGATWAVVAAWAAQAAGDPVTASRRLAAAPPETLARWRVSADEDIARLVAHASAKPGL